jgi:hypothetical protein
MDYLMKPVLGKKVLSMGKKDDHKFNMFPFFVQHTYAIGNGSHVYFVKKI